MALALGVTLLAGLATSVGGLLGVHDHVRRRGALAVALAFAAGIMLTVSVAEVLPAALGGLAGEHGMPLGGGLVALVFAAGALLVVLIDSYLPHSLNPADVEGAEEAQRPVDVLSNARLLRSGVLVAVTVGLHNLPEGMATFQAMLRDPTAGLSLAVAIAIHNVPEGIAVAAPVYAATGSRVQAFSWATLSGLAEPLGGVFGYLLLSWVLPGELVLVTPALVAGMMVAVSLRELVPASRRYQRRPGQSLGGLLAGAAVMVLSLVLLSL